MSALMINTQSRKRHFVCLLKIWHCAVHGHASGGQQWGLCSVLQALLHNERLYDKGDLLPLPKVSLLLGDTALHHKALDLEQRQVLQVTVRGDYPPVFTAVGAEELLLFHDAHVLPGLWVRVCDGALEDAFVQNYVLWFLRKQCLWIRRLHRQCWKGLGNLWWISMESFHGKFSMGYFGNPPTGGHFGECSFL